MIHQPLNCTLKSTSHYKITGVEDYNYHGSDNLKMDINLSSYASMNAVLYKLIENMRNTHYTNQYTTLIIGMYPYGNRKRLQPAV